jgi:hypothetical protein
VLWLCTPPSESRPIRCSAAPFSFAAFIACTSASFSKNVAVLHGLRDAGQLLIHDAARADVRVADLAVAHLAVRQADVHAGSADLRQRVFSKQLVEVRLVRGGNRVALRRGKAEAVHNHEYNWFFHNAVFVLSGSQNQPLVAASTIAAKSAGFREAPPMRPPSTSGCASSSAALPAFMEPPY